MSCILFSEPALQQFKLRLRQEYPDAKSSHLSEALARSLGFTTHAALLTDIRNPRRRPAPADDFRLLDFGAFRIRLKELTGIDDDDGLDAFEYGDYPNVIRTESGEVEPYKTPRERAWRNAVVAAINAGIDGGLFTIRPHDNRWAGVEHDLHSPSHGAIEFHILSGVPALAWFSDAGFGELNVGVTVNPTADAIRLRGGSLSFDFGDAVATGWLERKQGAWLQSSATQFKCRRRLLPVLADLQVEPTCFGDRGRVIL